MKTRVNISKINYKTNERYFDTVVGNSHTIKLFTGEKIKVVTDKRDNYWFVTHIESGLNLVLDNYYGYIVYDDNHDVFTEKNALESAKFCIEKVMKTKGITFKQMFEERKRQIERLYGTNRKNPIGRNQQN